MGVEKTKESERDAEYLREALRLVELRLDEQQKSADIIQRKAVLLITFCVAAASYAYAGRPDDFIKEWLPPVVWAAGNIGLAGVFIKSVFHGVKTLDITEWNVRGADAAYVLDGYFGGNFNKMAETLLEDYQNILDNNEPILRRKTEELLKARRWGLTGITGAFVWVVAVKIAQFWV